MNILKLFLSRKLIAIFMLGFSSGMPLLLTLSTLTNWLSREGLNIKTIGLFSMVGIPYSLKFCWSFIFDGKLPVISDKYGRRKSWLIIIQLLLIVAIIALGCNDPKYNLHYTALLSVVVAFLSASQDIVIDAFRIELLSDEEQTAGAVMTTYGYRVAMLVSGAGALLLSDYMEWRFVYMIMSGFIVIGIITVLMLKESKSNGESNDFDLSINSLRKLVVEPFIDLTKRENWFLIIIFIVLFKIPDATLGAVSSNFYVAMGFSNTEIALVVKSFGFIMILCGSFVGAYLAYKFGIIRALFLSAILQSISNLFFIIQVEAGYNIQVLYFVIAMENLSGAIGNVVIVAYLSKLCNLSYTASQFAILSSLSAIGRTFIAAPSGFIVAAYGWNLFFIVSSVLGIPAILLFRYLADPIVKQGR